MIRLEGVMGLHRRDKSGQFIAPFEEQPDGSVVYHLPDGSKVHTSFDTRNGTHHIIATNLPEGQIPENIAIAIRLESPDHPERK